MGSGEVHLKNHMKLIHSENQGKEEQFNCMECAFQGHSKFQLEKHIKFKHRNKGDVLPMLGTIKWRICSEEFEEKAN